MPKVASVSLETLNSAMQEKWARIQSRFQEEAVKNIQDPTMLKILKTITEKRKDTFRPSLTALACECVGGNVQAAEGAALIFALVSTGISIHDDIIDKSPHKHLRKTILGKYGLNMSLLVGDLLIVKGWSKITDLITSADSEKLAEVTRTYGDLCNEMCEAEFIENQFRRKLDTTIAAHEEMLWAAMAETEACTRIGAMLGGGSKDEVQALAGYGRRLGFTLRLIDEVKDTLNLEGNLIHRLKYESVPLPLLYVAKSSGERLMKLQAIIKKPDVSSSTVKTILELCFETDAFSYVVDRAKENADQTALCLRKVKKSFSKDLLMRLNQKVKVDLAALCV